MRYQVFDDCDEDLGIFTQLSMARAAGRKADGYSIYKGYWTRGIWAEEAEFVADVLVEKCDPAPDDPRARQALGFPEVPDDTPCLEFPAL